MVAEVAMRAEDSLVVGLAQMAPVWLDRERTLAKVITWVEDAATRGCALVAFGEARTQKELHAHYMDQSVQIERGDLDSLRKAAAAHRIAVIPGCIERPADRGGHSLYASLVYVTPAGEIGSVHRKLMPTYEERLTWSPGDGHGLRVHALGPFTVGGLNCWENWMPLPRAALYAQGEDLHVAIWPGGLHNTHDLTRVLAKEGRSYVLSVSGLMRPADVPAATPYREQILAGSAPFLANGGSCVSGPDGSWVIEPVIEQETLLMATLEHRRVREERQNFDPVGHYSRPDVTQLIVNRQRQSTLQINDRTE
jgi:nitrilase